MAGQNQDFTKATKISTVETEALRQANRILHLEKDTNKITADDVDLILFDSDGKNSIKITNFTQPLGQLKKDGKTVFDPVARQPVKGYWRIGCSW